MTVFLTEIKKCRGRKLWFVYLCAFAVMLLWIGGAIARNPLGPKEAASGYYYLLLNYTLMNLIFFPIVLATAASRVCDIENKGNTYKQLFTMQSRLSLFHCKLVLNGIYIFIFCLGETGSIYAMGKIFHVTQAVPLKLMALFFLSTFAVSLVLYTMQQVLSLLMTNQLMPLFIGLMGTFTGVFTAFFPNTILISLVPWGYYAVSSPIVMNYAKGETSFAIVPLPWGQLLGFLIFGLAFYVIGVKMYLKKEV